MVWKNSSTAAASPAPAPALTSGSKPARERKRKGEREGESVIVAAVEIADGRESVRGYAHTLPNRSQGESTTRRSRVS